MDREIVTEFESIPCPLLEPPALCEKPRRGDAQTCRAALIELERLRAIIACRDDHADIRGRYRKECEHRRED